MTDVVIEPKTSNEPEAEPVQAPAPEVHLKELLDGLDNEELHQKWNETMEKAKEPVRGAYKSLPVYKRLQVCSPDNDDDWQYGVVASMHNIEDPNESEVSRVVFSCYRWCGDDETFTGHLYEMTQLDKVRVLETNEEFDKSVTALNLDTRIASLQNEQKNT